ncbi:MAG: DUF2878 domain-containing protein [Pseudomonadota bacterium]
MRIKLNNYKLVLNFFWYQTIWFAAVLGGSQFEMLIIFLLVLHILQVADQKVELKILALCGGIGISVDSVLTWQGLFVFDPSPTVLPIPLWLMGIWFGFAGILRHSLNYIVTRPILAIGAGAFFAPLTYFAAARLGAVTFTLPVSLSAVVISTVWAALMALFSMCCLWVERTNHSKQSLLLNTINPAATK